MSNGKPKRPAREPERHRPAAAKPSSAGPAVNPAPVPRPPIPAREPVVAAAEAPPRAAAAAPISAPTQTPAPPAIPEPATAAVGARVAAASQEAAAAADDAWNVFAEAQAAFARGLEQIAGEVDGMTRSNLAVAADAAVALLGARTLAEAVEINAGLARRSLDALFAGSARLSEIAVKAMAEASRPLLSRHGEKSNVAAAR